MASKAKRKKRADPIAEPTPEQFGKGAFSRLTMAYRRIPVIDTMVSTGKLSRRQFDGLARYREIAGQEDRSPMRDSLDKALHGRSEGLGIPLSAMRATHELDRLESALGPTLHYARAIAVDDRTVSQVAISIWGGREKTANGSTFIVPRGNYAQEIMAQVHKAGDLLADSMGA
jgi:hypothetical protein